MSRDLFALGVCDLVLVLYTFTSYALVCYQVSVGHVSRGLIVMQHLLQCGLFALSAFFVFQRDWPWPQSGSLSLHTIVLFMKMHSYSRTNQELFADKHPLYPNNVSLANFIDFLLVPTLVYEPSYPRTDRVRFGYLIEKAICFIGAATLLYLDITHYMYPVFDALATTSFVESIVLLVFPFTLAYLLIFYLIFECVTNFMAEATCFADREFYEDWWNCTNFDEFSRRWNKPVHAWLLRHVYLESIRSYRVSKTNATVATFVFSMLLHELALTVTGRRFRPYIFALAMVQLLVIPLLRHPLFKGRRLGNVFFWLGILWGFPMLAVLYARENYNLPPPDATVVIYAGVVIGAFVLFAVGARVSFAYATRRSGEKQEKEEKEEEKETKEEKEEKEEKAAEKVEKTEREVRAIRRSSRKLTKRDL